MEETLEYGRVASFPHKTRSELDDIEELVRVYRTRIFRYAMLSLRDEDLAGSVTQDCFLRAHRARDTYRAECSVATWLLAIANNLIRDQLRRRKLRFWKSASVSSIDSPGVGSSLAAETASPEADLLARDELRRVWKIVGSLTTRQRQIFHLRFVEEMDLGEIAQAIGMNRNTVKSHLHRALAAVREAINEADA